MPRGITRRSVLPRVTEHLLEPLRAMRAEYAPFLMVYFAFGFASITQVADFFWTKQILNMTALELQLTAFWVGVPWTLKMLVGQFVDVRPILGSPRRAYIFLGAAAVALGYLMCAGLALRHPIVMSIGTPVSVYILAVVVVSIGLLVQDVTADAMTSEMNKGDERDARVIQVLGRIALVVGSLIAAIFSGGVAVIAQNGGKHDMYHISFLIGLSAPVISVVGVMLWKQGETKSGPWNKTILYGGFAFAAFVLLVQFLDTKWKAEIVWSVNVFAVGVFLYSLARTLDRSTVVSLLATCAVAFAYSAMPSAGPGVGWWQTDVLGFDQNFLGRLQVIGSIVSLIALFVAAKWLRNYSVTPVLAMLTIVGTIFSLPYIGMYWGLHEWTQAHLGFGARAIAIIDMGLKSPFDDLAMVPVLAFVAMIGRLGNPATWFALAASLLNLSLSTSTILTKWLTELYPVVQAKMLGDVVQVPGEYGNLGALLLISTTLKFFIPLITIWLLKRHVDYAIKVPS